MYTKSMIQQQIELFRQRELLKESINELEDKYIIKDNIFTLSDDGELKEVIRGYFVVEGEYEDLTSATKEITPGVTSIRVMEGGKYQVGRVYKFLSECPDLGQVICINYGR